MTKLYCTCIKGAILLQLVAVAAQKSRKCHNLSDYSLNDLDMTLKVIGKMSNKYFYEVYFLRSTNPCSMIN